MAKWVCTVCELETSVRKQYEELLQISTPLRTVEEFSEFLAQKYNKPLHVSKSALGRHKSAEHFSMGEKTIVVTVDDEVKNLRDFVGDMFIRFQKANKDKVPSHKEMIDLLLADAKLADIEQRRKDENLIKGLLLQASYKSQEVEVKQLEPRNHDPRPDGGVSSGEEDWPSG